MEIKVSIDFNDYTGVELVIQGRDVAVYVSAAALLGAISREIGTGPFSVTTVCRKRQSVAYVLTYTGSTLGTITQYKVSGPVILTIELCTEMLRKLFKRIPKHLYIYYYGAKQ